MKRYIRCHLIIIIAISSSLFGIINKSSAGEKSDIKSQFEQKYTVWKNFMNSPGKSILSDPTGTSTLYYKDIIVLGIPALPYIIEKMKQDSDLWVAFFEITKKRFTIEERKNNTIYDLNLNWWKEGYKQTPQQFEKLYNEWRSIDKQKEKKEAEIKYYEIKSLGILAIPEIIKKVESGDNSLIPLISYLTNNEVKETATATECIEWWKTNKDKWALHQDEK